MNLCTFPRNIIKNSNKNSSYLNGINNENIRIVQWNIFAQGFVVSDGFRYCSTNDLTLDKRIKLYRKEFEHIQGDIYCLQEADIHSTLCNILNEHGSKYEDIFCPKIKSPCLMYPENFGPDGCCIIYNKEKLECLHQENLFLEKTGSYVSLFAIFCFKSNPTLKFIVVCTHLKSKRHFKMVRVVQGKLLMAKVLELMSLWEITSGFVCGDFNAHPDESVIQEMKKSPLNFVNVYDYLRGKEEENEYYTTWVFKKEESQSKRSRAINTVYSDHVQIPESEFTEVIDYMWFVGSPSSLLQIDPSQRTATWPLAIEDVPRKQDIGDRGIPCPDSYPSDHLSLVADYCISMVPP